MIMYQLFYSVTRSKKPSYTETKVFALEKDAIQQAIPLCQCENVKFVSIRTVDVKSIHLSVYKKSDTCELSEPYEDLSAPKLDMDKVIFVGDSLCNTTQEYKSYE